MARANAADLGSEVSLVLEHWEQVLSQWRTDSDLSRYNRGEAETPDLSRVIKLAEEVRRASGGAFDHHILEKVHAAGFGPAGHGEVEIERPMPGVQKGGFKVMLRNRALATSGN